MSVVKKAMDGGFYIFARTKSFKNVWMVKEYYLDKDRKTPIIKGQIQLSSIYFPKELIGKRVRFRIEVVEE